ncbi:hypothetical protein [Gemmatimonas sp.]|uniref:hypothetical protein n=1 Tax=Gemmatimonas sp. TaxID=1962908 RepID=UPI00356B37A3
MAGKQMQENVAETLQPRTNAKQKFGLQATLPMNRVSAGFLEQKIEDHNATRGDQIDPHDLIATLDFAGSENQKGKIIRNLEYLQKADRLRCQLQLWPDGRFHRGGHDIPHASPGGNELYAIDDMEYIYTSAQPAKSGTFHHSSFLSGKPLLCAGEITLAAGHVVHIDNLSGHYQPNTSYLLRAVEVLLGKYHVNLGQVTIMDMAQQGVEWRSAGEFLRLRGRPPIRLTANRRR